MQPKGLAEATSTGRAEGHPVYQQAPTELRAVDEDRIVRLDPPRECTFCSRTIETAKVVHIEDTQYEYACLGCATLA